MLFVDLLVYELHLELCAEIFVNIMAVTRLLYDSLNEYVSFV